MNILKYIKRWFQKSLESKKSYPDIQREKDFLHSGKSFFQQTANTLSSTYGTIELP